MTIPASANNGQQDCVISIGTGATLSVNEDIQIDSNYKLYNQGTIKARNIKCTNSSFFYNAGNVEIKESLCATNESSTTLNAGDIKTTQVLISGDAHIVNEDTGNIEVANNTEINCTGGSWENNGKWTTNDMWIYASNNSCINRCQLTVRNELKLTDVYLIIDGGGFVQCNKTYMNNARIDLGAKSLFEVTQEAKYGYQTQERGFKGTGAEKALIVIKKATEENPGNANMIHYSGNLQIICSDHPEADLSWGKRWTLTNGAEWAEEGSNTVSIPQTECNEGYNTSTPTPPVNPSFPIIVDDDKDYTYMFEDQWPLYGDYDMNDIVMTMNKRKLYINKDNKVEKIELSIELRAVGATKKISAAIMLDEVSASTIKTPVKFGDGSIIKNFNLNSANIEKGQDLAVIPLFDDAHMALGRNRYEAINTINGSQNNADYKTIELTVEFDNPTLTADAFNIDKLNLFIFAYDNRNVRKEIHIIGFQPTKQMETDLFGSNDDNSNIPNKKYYISKENLAWGIMIPTSFKWPKEYTNIKNAYPEFENWVTSGGKENENWWNHSDTNKVF